MCGLFLYRDKVHMPDQNSRWPGLNIRIHDFKDLLAPTCSWVQLGNHYSMCRVLHILRRACFHGNLAPRIFVYRLNPALLRCN
jgi:hypothetical protein